MVYAHRVVGGLCQLVEYAHIALCHSCSSEYRSAEILLAHYLRAGEGEKNASRLYLLNSLCVEPAVANERVAQAVAVFGKRRRVEYNQVVVVAHTVEEVECIFGVCCVALVAGEV